MATLRARISNRLRLDPLEVRDVPTVITLYPYPDTVKEHGGSIEPALFVIQRTDTSLDEALVVQLSSSDTTEMTVPTSVTIPAGQTAATFNGIPRDDSLLDGTQPVTITARVVSPNEGMTGAITLDSSWGNSGWVGSNLIGGLAIQPDGKMIAAGTLPGSGTNYTDFHITRYLKTGERDGAFGSSGNVVIDISGMHDRPEVAIVQPDGKILVAGTGGNGPNFDYVLARINSDGSLDATFGNGGKLFLDMGTGNYNEAWDMVLQGDGQIIVAGNINGQPAVTQLNSDGSLDATYGTNGSSVFSFGSFGSRLFGVVLQPDGKVIAAGDYAGGNSIAQYSVARLNTDGSLDSTFGTNGKVLTNFTGDFDNGQDVALLPDGKIVVVGNVGRSGIYPPVYDIGIARYNANGTLDTTFGTNGLLIQTTGSAYYNPVRAAVQSDGRLVVSGTTGTSPNSVRGQIFRYSPAGVLENSTYSAYNLSYSENLAIDANGGIYFGYTYSSGTTGYIERYKSSGTPTILAEHSVTLSVLDNDPYLAVTDSYSVAEDGTLTVDAATGLLANDTITLPIQPRTYRVSDVGTSYAGPANGTLTLNDNGSFTYTPYANFSGTDTFYYRIYDGAALSNIVAVTINVIASPDAPVAVNDSYTTNEDTPLVVNNVPTFSNGTSISLQSQTGDWIGSGQNYNYGASSGSYSIYNYGVAGVRLYFSILGTNTYWNFYFAGPTTQNRLMPGTYLNATRFNSANNAGIDVTTSGRGSNQTSGWLIVHQAEYNAAGNIVRLAVDFEQRSDSASGVLRGQVRYNALAPTVGGLLLNDNDADGNPLTAQVVASPANGTLNLASNGTFTYTPNPNFFGTDSFTYKANDGTTDSNVATVNITVNAVNDAPITQDDRYAGTEDTTLSVDATSGVLANDSDVEGSPLVTQLVSTTTRGSLTLNNDGSFTYIPNANTNGTDSFTYRATDGSLGGIVRTVTLTIAAVNDPPVANPNSYALDQDTTLTIDAAGVLANDSDVDGNPLSAIVAALPTHGTLNLAADGSFVYVPNAGYFGSDSFTYKANDGTNDSNTTTVALTINKVNHAPVANVESYSVLEDNTLGVPVLTGVLANDSDSDGDPLTTQLIATTVNGSLTLNADGSFTYTPNANFHGSDSFTYKASDGVLTSATTTVTLTVQSVNDVPVATGESYTLDEDTTLTVNAPGLLANDTDADQQTLASQQVSGPAHGTLTLNANGSFTYTPTSNYHGLDSFTYKVSDGTAESNTVTVDLTVRSVNDVPVANSDSYTVREDGVLLAGSAPVLPTPVLNYNFDEASSGTTATLDRGTAPLTNGNFVGSATRTNNGFAGSTAALNLANGAGYVTPGSATDVNSLSSMTATFWLNLRNGSTALGGKRILGTGPTNIGTLPAGTRGWSLGFSDFNPLGSVANRFYPNFYVAESTGNGSSGASGILSPVSLNALNDWVFLAVTFNSHWSPGYSLATLYSGGTSGEVLELGNSAFIGSSLTGTNPTNLIIGDPSSTIPAWLDDVRIYDRALMPAELEAIRASSLGIVNPVLTANDTDVESTTLATSVVNGPANGTLVLGTDGRFVYQPNANFNGTDSFTYRVHDGTTYSSPATVNVTVNPSNDAPYVPTVNNVIFNEDTTYAFTGATKLIATDVDSLNNPSAVVNLKLDFMSGSGTLGVAAASGATVTGNNSTIVNVTGPLSAVQATLATLTLTPLANINNNTGNVPVLRLTLDDQANGGPGNQITANWVTMSINPVNDAPTINAGANLTINENAGAQTVANWLTGTSTGPADEASQTVTYEVVGNSNPSLFAVAPTIDANRTLRYAPATNASGTATITYRARDNGGTANGGVDVSATRTATITIRNTPNVVAAVVNQGETQRSRVTRLDVTFDGLMDTTLLRQSGTFTIKKTGSNTSIGTVSVVTNTVNNRTVATLTFSGSNTESGSLADGRWTLTVLANRVRDTSTGTYMASSYTVNTHRLFGDADGDADVDATDRTAFDLAYGSSSGQSNYRTHFDFDLSGAINNNDRTRFNQRFGKTV